MGLQLLGNLEKLLAQLHTEKCRLEKRLDEIELATNAAKFIIAEEEKTLLQLRPHLKL